MFICLRDTVHVDGVCGFQAWEEGWGPGGGEVENVGCLLRVHCVWTLLISGLGTSHPVPQAPPWSLAYCGVAGSTSVHS